MTTPRRSLRTWAIGASALAHLAVLLMVLLQRPSAPLPIGEETAPPEQVIHVLLMPRPRAVTAGRAAPSPVRAHQPRQPAEDTGPPRAPSQPVAPALAPAAESPPAADLRAALRHGAAGCANLTAIGISRAEREHCEDQIARGTASAPFMPAALEPRLRAYYDAVALAKQRDPPHVAVVNKAPIPGDPPPHRPGGDHLPAFYCSLHFGAGAQPKRLPHALYLGPHCVIEPPKGALDPEVDITPP